MSLNGILIVDKPAQWTSHDVCAKLRGVLKQRRVGHGGTLDPMATGVLPVFIGRATRAAEFCENSEKEYIAGLRLGIVTDTQDITGTVVKETDALGITDFELKAVLPSFVGRQKQIPPMYSAVKKDGKKLYELARKGIEVERKAREIEIFDIEIVEEPTVGGAVPDASPDVILRVACSKGTYIRTLCHDIGQALGCGAVLSYLRRTKAGVFTTDMAHPLDAVTGNDSTASEFLLPVDSIFSQYPSAVLGDADTRKARNGAVCTLPGIADGKYRFYGQNGEFLLFGEVKNNIMKTIKNFFEV